MLVSEIHITLTNGLQWVSEIITKLVEETSADYTNFKCTEYFAPLGYEGRKRE